MNEIEINVDINQNKLVAPVIELLQNDYNSTKFIFNFTGDDNYTKVLQLQLPDGSIWIKDIVNNQIVLADEKDGKLVPILVQNGKYIFDVAVYSNNAKLTTTNRETFFVRSELTGETIELDDRLPILDRLITETNNLDVSVEKTDERALVTLSKKDGTNETVEILDGKDYVLTEEDKAEILEIVKQELETQSEYIKTAEANEVVKDGVVSNPLELTTAEKNNAQDWLGLKWKTLCADSSDYLIALPEEFNELKITVRDTANYNYSYLFYLLKEEVLNNKGGYFVNGYYFTTHNGFCTLYISADGTDIVTATYRAGTATSETKQVSVFYR